MKKLLSAVLALCVVLSGFAFAAEGLLDKEGAVPFAVDMIETMGVAADWMEMDYFRAVAAAMFVLDLRQSADVPEETIDAALAGDSFIGAAGSELIAYLHGEAQDIVLFYDADAKEVCYKLTDAAEPEEIESALNEACPDGVYPLNSEEIQNALDEIASLFVMEPELPESDFVGADITDLSEIPDIPEEMLAAMTGEGMVADAFVSHDLLEKDDSVVPMDLDLMTFLSDVSAEDWMLSAEERGMATFLLANDFTMAYPEIDGTERTLAATTYLGRIGSELIAYLCGGEKDAIIFYDADAFEASYKVVDAVAQSTLEVTLAASCTDGYYKNDPNVMNSVMEMLVEVLYSES